MPGVEFPGNPKIHAEEWETFSELFREIIPKTLPVRSGALLDAFLIALPVDCVSFGVTVEE